MLTLTTLGAIDLVHRDRGSLSTLLAQPKRLALCIYLVVKAPGGFIRRDSLLAAFWPEADETRARAALRQALQFLRRTLGDDVVRTRGDDEVGIDPTLLRCDVVAFRAERDAGRAADALAHYRGPFLPGLLIDEAPAVEGWIARERDALAREAALLAGQLADAALASDPRVAVSLARQAVTLAPLDEPAARRLAVALDTTGDRAGAVQALQALEQRLREELEVSPSPETVALGEALRTRTTARAMAPATTSAVAAEPLAPSTPPVHAPPARPPAPGPVGARWLLGALAIALVALAAAIGVGRDSAAPASPAVAAPARTPPRILVAPFANLTGDPALAPVGTMTADWITEGLSRVEGLTVVPLSAVTAAARTLQPDSGDARSVAARLAGDLGATILVNGSAYRTGRTLHLQARVTDSERGALLGPVQTVSVGADSVMVAIDRLRTRVVASLTPLGDTVSHLRGATPPPSYEAYRDYVAGLETFVQGDARRALDRFARAADADPTWPMPRIAQAIMLSNLGRVDSAARLAEAVATTRDRLGPLERATLDMLRGMLAGDLAAIDRAVRVQARLAPGTIGEYMVAETARRRGAAGEAVAILRHLGPDRGELRGWQPYWRELTGALHQLGRHDEELAAARAARERYPRDGDVGRWLARALAATGQTAAVDALVEDAVADPAMAATVPGRWLAIAAAVRDARGDRVAAARWRERELALYRRATGAQRSVRLRVQQASAMLLSGARAAARDSLAALDRPPLDLPAVIGLTGVAAAQDGDTATVRTALARLDAVDRARTPVQRATSDGDTWYWRAAIAAQRRDAAGTAAALSRGWAGGAGRDPDLATDPWLAPVRTTSPLRELLRVR